MSADSGEGAAERGRDAPWPFFVIYGVMWAGMIGTTLNTDPVKPGLTLSTVVMMPLILGVLVALAWARWYGRSLFGSHFSKTMLGNLSWHVFVLTGVIFLSYLFFDAVVQLLMFGFGVPMFTPGCAVSERDTALFVWEAMAKGAFKFLARYLHIPTEACAPNALSWTVAVTMQCIRWYTALVVVWHALSFAMSWLRQLRTQRG